MDVAADIHALEEQLLSEEVRRSEARLMDLLAPDFLEFGASGQVWDRTTAIKALREAETSASELSSSLPCRRRSSCHLRSAASRRARFFPRLLATKLNLGSKGERLAADLPSRNTAARLTPMSSYGWPDNREHRLSLPVHKAAAQPHITAPSTFSILSSIKNRSPGRKPVRASIVL